MPSSHHQPPTPPGRMPIMSIIIGMMAPMMIFISKTEPLEGWQSIKRAVLFVNEFLSGRLSIAPRTAPGPAQEDDRGAEPPEKSHCLATRTQQGLACGHDGRKNGPRPGPQALV